LPTHRIFCQAYLEESKNGRQSRNSTGRFRSGPGSGEEVSPLVMGDPGRGVGTGQIQMSAKMDAQSGQVQTFSSHSGPVVEVVVTTQTKIYKDTTMQQYNGQPPQGQTIQQVIKPGSIDEIGQSSTITVWGKKTGDRYIADILVYSTPTFIPKPKLGAPPG
jgi:hypothetical protein